MLSKLSWLFHREVFYERFSHLPVMVVSRQGRLLLQTSLVSGFEQTLPSLLTLVSKVWALGALGTQNKEGLLLFDYD